MIVLASKSPRRKEIFKKLNLPFITFESHIDEFIDTDKPLEEAVMALSYKKAFAAKETYKDNIIIGADTIVALDGKILGKPKDNKDAFRILKTLSGREHSVITGVTIMKENKHMSFADISFVSFYPLSDKEILDYIASGEAYGKAGASSIQGLGALFIKDIKGDYYSIMGLPIARLNRVLKEFM